ncbi:hypothetical protein [Rhizobium sp. TRM95796]|uniref:hypothetical protein n=1 Tax=Rhizobium sp. TRM95796 TaxID=2979862 RepID=UPI0021E6DEBE|nr:hypothetical protein [Rhizobium sp. TRM95796]MCV3764566.1 hypothetical protein [Rhizobium sp. TRM95796]
MGFAQSQFEAFALDIRGQRVSSVWRGNGSALFVEVGALFADPNMKSGFGRRLIGEFGIMIQWSWRIEGETSILCGSWTEEDDWERHFQSLVGRRVEDLSLFARLPELNLALEGDTYVVTFNTGGEQPEWALFRRTPEKGTFMTLHVDNGCVVEEARP